MRPSPGSAVSSRAFGRPLAGLLLPLLLGALLSCALVVAGSANATSSPACPARGPHRVTSNPWPAAQHELAPEGPHMIILCRYAGLDSQPTFKLTGSHVVAGGATLDRLVRRFDLIRPFPRHQAFACPNDDGSQVVATLHYRRHTVRISVGLGGCNVVTNGDLRRSAANLENKNPVGPKLLAELRALTSPPRG